MISWRSRNKSLPAKRDRWPRQGPAQAIALPWVQCVLTSQRLVHWSRQQETAGEVRTFCSTWPSGYSNSSDCGNCSGCRATYLKSLAQFRSLRSGDVDHEYFRFNRPTFVLACLFVAGRSRADGFCLWCRRAVIFGEVRAAGSVPGFSKPCGTVSKWKPDKNTRSV